MTALLLLLATGAPEAEDGARLDWMETVYADGRHNAFTDLVRWKDAYYVCFRHGASHGSMDGEIRVMRSADLRTWAPCGTLDTAGDDRDPHFVATDDELLVYFGVWDLRHGTGTAPPDRGAVRSHFASTHDGATWSAVRGVYEPGWWLWRVRRHDGAFYSAAYTAVRPKPDSRETRLVRSENGVDWTTVSTVTGAHMAGEADLLFAADGSMRLLSRTGNGSGNAYWYSTDSGRQVWTEKDTGVLVHAPGFAEWKDRLFVAGRAKGADGYVTRLWEVRGDELVERLTLPSGGDTSYPGLIVDPASLDGEAPGLFVTWYSQHEGGDGNAAGVYAARVTVR